MRAAPHFHTSLNQHNCHSLTHRACALPARSRSPLSATVAGARGPPRRMDPQGRRRAERTRKVGSEHKRKNLFRAVIFERGTGEQSCCFTQHVHTLITTRSHTQSCEGDVCGSITLFRSSEVRLFDTQAVHFFFTVVSLSTRSTLQCSHDGYRRAGRATRRFDVEKALADVDADGEATAREPTDEVSHMRA
jgi:hypothetical protein